MFEEKRDNFFYRLTRFFEKDFDKKSLVKLFGAGLVCSALAWLLALFAPPAVAGVVGFLCDLEERFFYYLLIFPFFFGFLMSFAACKYIFRKHDQMLVSEDEFMSRYAEHSKGENLRRIFLISAMVGGINAILLVLAVIWFREI